MTSRLVIVALVLLVHASSASAEVLVYSGTVQHLATGDDPSSQSRKTYVVVDQFNKRIGFMSWGRDAIGKQHDVPDIRNIDYLGFPRGDGLVEDGYASATALGTFTGVGGGGYAGLFIHGPQAPLVVSIAGTVKNIQPRAKVLTGTDAGAATTFLGAFYTCNTYKVAFDQKLTVQANGADDTVDSAMAQLVGLVEAMGYVAR